MEDIGVLFIDLLLAMAKHDMLIKQGIILRYHIMIYFHYFFHQIKMAIAVAMMIGGAFVNALAFTGGKFFILKTWQKQ